jgi:glycosyltransferase involved in cell wall biosynthesis
MLGWELPPHNSGGLGIACYQLCKALAKKGADIEFVLPYTAKHPGVEFMRVTAAHPQDVEAVMKAGMAYESYKYVKKTGEVRYIDLFGQTNIYEEAVGRIARLGEFDVIHAHDWMTFRAALRAKMITGKPLIAHVHTVEADRAGKEFGGNSLCREIEATALSLADRVVAISERTKYDIVREYGIPEDKIEVVHNHFDPTADLNFMDQPEDTKNAYVYLDRMRGLGYGIVSNIGRMTIQKGLPNLLYAFKIVHDHVPRSLLLLAGAGEQRNELVALAADLGLGDSVVFAGFQRGKRYGDTFKIADVFAMPSFSEPFGIAAMEAVVYGTPLVISKQAGVTEVIRHCLTADHWDVKELANKITAILQNKALGQELSQNATKEFEKHSWDDSADKLWNVYHEPAGACV